MMKRLVSLLLLVSFCAVIPVDAKTIIWVAEAGRDDDADGRNDAQDWVDKLTAAGYEVDFRPGNWAALTDALVVELNAADLVVASCTTQSGTYATDAAEITRWNSVTKPLMLTSPYIARSNRWQWINNGDGTLPSNNGDQGSPLLQAVVPTHPIFVGVPLDNHNQLSAIDPALGSGHASYLATNNPGNGTLLAKTVPTDLVQDWCWIVEWKAGTPFYNGSAYTPAGPRMYVMGIGAHEVPGTYPMRAYNLTDDGWKLFSNIVKYMLGEPLLPDTMASEPSPSDGLTDVPCSVALSWSPGTTAQAHDVYLGTSLEDVNNASRTNPLGVLAVQDHGANTFDPAGNLAYGTTYYWRVDEVGAGMNGAIWSFTTEPYSYPVATPIQATASSSMGDKMGPANTVNTSGLDPATDQHSFDITDMWVSSTTGPQPTWIQYEFDRVRKLDRMWVWNSNQAVEDLLGYGVKQAKVEVSTDGTTWTEVPNVPEFSQATGLDTYVHNTTVDLGGAVARCVRLTCLSTWGGGEIYSLSEVRFFEVPMRAREPKPASGATDVQPDALLTWRPGRQAARHEVYFGTDPNALVLAQTVTEDQVTLSSLGVEYGQTYSLRVDEVNDAALPQSWEGDVWSLSTQVYRVVDNFESYNDQCNRVYYAWKGGAGNSENADCGVSAYSGNGTGSAVGNNDPPYAERTNVHSGAQAMPFFYDNTSGSGVSEAVLTFTPAQDWTAAGLRTLVLFFRGDLANGAGQVYLKINGAKISYSASALQTDLWNQWNVDLSSLSVQAVSSLTVGVSGTGQGVLYVDDIRLYRQAPAAATEQVYIETESATPAVPEPWVLTDDPLVSGGRYVTTPTTAANSTDGPTVGVLTYSFTVAGGDYRLWFRIGPLAGYSNDSLWVRIQGATIDPTGNAAHPGWVRFNGMAGQSGAGDWHWGPVIDDEHESVQVTFTLPAGTHTLEVAHREAGVPLDAILIANN